MTSGPLFSSPFPVPQKSQRAFARRIQLRHCPESTNKNSPGGMAFLGRSFCLNPSLFHQLINSQSTRETLNYHLFPLRLLLIKRTINFPYMKHSSVAFRKDLERLHGPALLQPPSPYSHFEATKGRTSLGKCFHGKILRRAQQTNSIYWRNWVKNHPQVMKIILRLIDNELVSAFNLLINIQANRLNLIISPGKG